MQNIKLTRKLTGNALENCSKIQYVTPKIGRVRRTAMGSSMRHQCRNWYQTRANVADEYGASFSCGSHIEH
jgi:hypothetical protein